MRWRFVLSKKAEVARNSKETRLRAGVDLDGSGRVKVATGLAFLDHMLDQVARYGGFNLTLRGAGDVHVDPHHLVEDAGIVLGQALSQALGDRAGITRFASAYAPLDEALARVVIDLGKRPYLSYNVSLRGRLGDVIRGRNRHHIAEATFKALGLALGQAMASGGQAGIPSSKGLL